MDKRDPQHQYQIGEPVVYEPEGVVTRVIGYVWKRAEDGTCRIDLYRLDCGIDVVEDHIRPLVPEDPADPFERGLVFADEETRLRFYAEKRAEILSGRS